MFAYCQNNPIIYEDQTGTSVTLSVLLAGLIGGAINVVTTLIAAKATVQEYTITDAAAAFAVGMINAYGGPLAGGLASGVYAALCAFSNGATPTTAAVCFAVSGSMTAFSIGNLANLGTSSVEALFATTAADMSFGAGYNMISAATYKVTVKQPQLPNPWDSNAFYPSNGLYSERLQSILDKVNKEVLYGN